MLFSLSLPCPPTSHLNSTPPSIAALETRRAGFDHSTRRPFAHSAFHPSFPCPCGLPGLSAGSMPVKHLFYSATFPASSRLSEGYELRAVQKDAEWRPYCAYCDSTLSADRCVKHSRGSSGFVLASHLARSPLPKRSGTGSRSRTRAANTSGAHGRSVVRRSVVTPSLRRTQWARTYVDEECGPCA